LAKPALKIFEILALCSDLYFYKSTRGIAERPLLLLSIRRRAGFMAENK
jgi:hypothetical protein